MKIPPTGKGLRKLAHPSRKSFILTLKFTFHQGRVLFLLSPALDTNLCISSDSHAASSHWVHTACPMPNSATQAHLVLLLQQTHQSHAQSFCHFQMWRKHPGAQHGVWLPEKSSEGQPAWRTGCPLEPSPWDKLWPMGNRKWKGLGSQQTDHLDFPAPRKYLEAWFPLAWHPETSSCMQVDASAEQHACLSTARH